MSKQEMDQSSPTLLGSDALPPPRSGWVLAGIWCLAGAFRKDPAFLKSLMSPLTDSEAASTEQDLKSYLTKKVSKVPRDECTMFCVFGPAVNLPITPAEQHIRGYRT